MTRPEFVRPTDVIEASSKKTCQPIKFHSRSSIDESKSVASPIRADSICHPRPWNMSMQATGIIRFICNSRPGFVVNNLFTWNTISRICRNGTLICIFRSFSDLVLSADTLSLLSHTCDVFLCSMSAARLRGWNTTGRAWTGQWVFNHCVMLRQAVLPRLRDG